MITFKDTICSISLNGEVTEEIANQIVLGIQAANANDAITDIELAINSAGGSVLAGFTIYSELHRSSKNITTINSGCCLSIASIIFLAGNVRKAYDYSLLMIHDPYNEGGEGDDEVLKLFKNSLITILKNSFKEDNLNELMSKETWYTAEQLHSKGIISEVLPSDINFNLIETEETIKNIYVIMNNYIKNKNNEMKNLEVKNEDLKEVANEEMASTSGETETEIVIENQDSEEFANLVAELKSLIAELKSENETLKAENEGLKNANETAIVNEKETILNKAGIEPTEKWMSFQITELKELVNSVKIKKSPVLEIENKTIVKGINDYSKEELKEIANNNPELYLSLYRAERNKKK